MTRENFMEIGYNSLGVLLQNGMIIKILHYTKDRVEYCTNHDDFQKTIEMNKEVFINYLVMNFSSFENNIDEMIAKQIMIKKVNELNKDILETLLKGKI